MTDRDHGRATAVAWLAHPVTLLSLTVLLLNDHVLKDRYPGFVTGKLSDVAGLILLPPLLALAWPRRAVWPPVLVTGAGFLAVKAIPAAAGLASAGWSALVGPSVIRADWTDVLALPALALAWWVGRTARPATRRPGAVVTLVLLPLATLAVAATSAPQYPSAIEVWETGGRVLAGVTVSYHPREEPDFWRISDDGGRTWTEVEPPGFDVESVRRPREESRQACEPTAPDHCYRVVPGHLRVEETADGGTSWRVAWGVDEETRRRLARRYDDIGDVAADLSSRSVAVVARPGGHAVVVANGRDGFALRDVDGTWERVGFATEVRRFGGPITDRIPPLEPRSLVDVAPEAVLGVLATLLAVLIVAAVAHWPARRWPALAATPAFGAGASVALTGAAWYRNSAGDGVAGAPVVFGLVLAFCCVGALVVTLATTRIVGWPAAASVLLAAATGVGTVVGVYLAWTDAVLSHRSAGLVAVTVAVLVLAVTALLLRRPAR
jgi:hypothetical protein